MKESIKSIPEAEQLMLKVVEQARRNEAIAEMLLFKKYLPSELIASHHNRQYNNQPMKWFYIENVGRFNSFELKFHSDWNWMVSAVIEMKKYQYTHTVDNKLKRIYELILATKIVDLDLTKLWTLVSDYALELQKQKQIETNKS